MIANDILPYIAQNRSLFRLGHEVVSTNRYRDAFSIYDIMHYMYI